jgi:hypothetical protein
MSISELNHPESSLIDLDRVAHLLQIFGGKIMFNG